MTDRYDFASMVCNILTGINNFTLITDINKIKPNNIADFNNHVINDGPILRFIVNNTFYFGELKSGKDFIIEENGLFDSDTFGICKNTNPYDVAFAISRKNWIIEYYD